MSPRVLPTLLAGVLLLTQSLADVPFTEPARKPSPKATAKPAAAKPEPKATPAPGEAMEKDKLRLDRLITELQRSSRSFIYLRSVGFTETDAEFEKLIAANSSIFRPTRIIRRDKDGKRQIPGWPGVTLTDTYKVPGKAGAEPDAPATQKVEAGNPPVER